MCSLLNIQSNFFLQKIFNNLKQEKILKLLKNSNQFQKILNIDLITYKRFYNQIEIEIIPIDIKDKNGFIHIPIEYESYCHIYFNDNNKEIKRSYFTKEDKVTKIKIILDEEIKSFEKLFYMSDCIEKISFIKFNRRDITNMKEMFSGCTELKEINFNKFNTDNVTNMSYMFYKCKSLKELNLDKFNINNITDISYMFFECSALNELNLITFDTNNLICKIGMFDGCSNELKRKIAKTYRNILH